MKEMYMYERTKFLQWRRLHKNAPRWCQHTHTHMHGCSSSGDGSSVVLVKFVYCAVVQSERCRVAHINEIKQKQKPKRRRILEMNWCACTTGCSYGFLIMMIMTTSMPILCYDDKSHQATRYIPPIWYGCHVASLDGVWCANSFPYNFLAVFFSLDFDQIET